eukprot:TRINITY_DN111869_c0_g1_i1.p1 TRINITY_DN111869_c0_g1~~TRINITY_DN111869_c0_g1_i1.p1  ORF type:complete len:1036 (-),score=338.47 TRINITY_DN111869_c0_g1_i1:167-3274(-)
MKPHAESFEAVLKSFESSLEAGLSEEQVRQALEKYGPNELAQQEKKSIWKLIAEQFEDLLVRILLASAAVSFFLAYFDEKSAEEGWTAYVEPLVILLILIANAFVGVWQESNAEAALDALKKLQPDHAMVLRGGRWESIDAVDLVPGDVVEVKVGDKVPADMRMCKLKTTTIRIEQSQLTGESQSVSKEVQPVTGAKAADCVIQEKTNMLFASTTVSNGAAVGIVTSTGMQTEIGIIQSAVTEAAEDEEQTPLQKKLDEFGEQLAKVIFVICAVVWIINYKHFFDPMHGTMLRGCIYYFKIAVALAVAAIPEGLPAVITTCLALGTRKMAQRNAIVRKLPSVETLGCTTVICSDKTGTLTTNEMCCKKMALPTGASQLKIHSVEGHTYAPIGSISDLSASDVSSNKGLQAFATCGAVCNESRLLVTDEGRFSRAGEPTEAALRVLVEKMGCPDKATHDRCFQAKTRTKADAMAFSDHWMSGVKKLATLEFNRDRKSMSVLVKKSSDAANSLYVKGAPESILDRCTSIMLPDGSTVPLSAEGKKAVQARVTEMAKEALRTLGLAMKSDLEALKLADYDGPSHPGHAQLTDPDNFKNVEQELTFLGLVGIIDPPRPECKQAIEECRIAGISVIMITGDNPDTAKAIAQQLGILSASSSGTSQKTFTGKEFDDLSEARKTEVLQRIMDERDSEGAVFARTEPKHKQMIVKILKSLGEISAMTGDGVNDAPALKQADIGIAMGITGTEVAKEASDMVLADDNFSTIVAAVEEGRSIYNNMKAFIRYLISSNIGEVASILLTAILGVPEGLAPVQLLWVNLVTDGLPATALGFNPPDLNVMQKPPRRKDDNLISGWVFFRYMVIGMYVGIATVGIFMYWYVSDYSEDGHTLVSMGELVTWGKCAEWQGFAVKPMLDMTFEKDPCAYFTTGKVKASTLSLTVLVIIEMLNAFNALSEDGSLIQRPPWTNPWLILACMGSVMVHFVVLYTPFLAKIFHVCPLDWHDWVLVMAFSFPVLLIDEVLKFVGRRRSTTRVVPHKSD